MHTAGRPNAVVSLDRYRLAVTRNREYARRVGDEEDSASQLEEAIMRDGNVQR